MKIFKVQKVRAASKLGKYKKKPLHNTAKTKEGTDGQTRRRQMKNDRMILAAVNAVVNAIA